MAVEIEFPPVNLDPTQIITGIERCPYPQYHGFLDAIHPTIPFLVGEDGVQRVARFYEKDGGSNWQAVEWLVAAYGDGRSPTARSPGRYTGEMRKIVQYLAGMGAPITYEHGFWKTHGVFITADEKPWLIEISQANGVLAKRLPTCENTQVPPPPELRYHPVPPWFPFPSGDNLELAISQGTIIRLLPASALTDFYARNAFFTSCGWAFSSDGQSAANTCWSTQANYRHGYLFVIDITQANNAPENATVRLVRSGIIWGLRQNSVKFPDDLSGTLRSFDTSYNQPSPGAQDTAPLYVYYDGLTRVEVNYSSATPTSYQTVYYWPGGIFCSELPRNVDIYGGPRWEDWSGDVYKPQGPHLASEPLDYNGDKDGEFETFPPVSRQSNPFSYNNTTGDRYMFPSSVIGEKIILRNVQSSEIFSHGIIVPFEDREAIYVYKRRAVNLTSTLRRYEKARMGAGQGYWLEIVFEDPQRYWGNLTNPGPNTDVLYSNCPRPGTYEPPMPTTEEDAKPEIGGNEYVREDIPNYSETSNNSILRLVASGGVDEVVRESSDDDQFNPYEGYYNDEFTSLLMAVWRDPFNGRIIASSEMNSLTNPYLQNASGYPGSSLITNVWAKAWLGIP